MSETAIKIDEFEIELIEAFPLLMGDIAQLQKFGVDITAAGRGDISEQLSFMAWLICSRANVSKEIALNLMHKMRPEKFAEFSTAIQKAREITEKKSQDSELN